MLNKLFNLFKKQTHQEIFPEERHSLPAMDWAHANIYVGKIIGDIKGTSIKILFVHDDMMEVEILTCRDSKLKDHLIVEEQYALHRTMSGEAGESWVISKDQLKSNIQLMLRWQKDLGWNWELS